MSPRARPVIPGIPAAGHISVGGSWHPRTADGCQKCPPEWRRGEAVTVIEYGPDRRRRRGGQRFTAIVTSTSGRYVLIRYDHPDVSGRDHDQFYAESGWRAMDGELRWKLHHGRPPAR